jgi:flagellar hook-length control protein FliK
LESGAGREVLAAARRLHDGGRTVALATLLMELPDPRLQSMLVAVDEETTERGPVDAQERINHLQDALRRRSAERQAHASARQLKTSRLDPGSEAALLEQLVVQRRAAQGMTNPKEG